jgi:hypothetical protein
LLLFPGSGLKLHSGPGTDTSVDVYWNQAPASGAPAPSPASSTPGRRDIECRNKGYNHDEKASRETNRAGRESGNSDGRSRKAGAGATFKPKRRQVPALQETNQAASQAS